MGEKKGMGAGEVLEKTVSRLEAEFKPRIITFSNRVFAEIADDSDWHRSRTGYMTYGQAGLYKFSGSDSEWMIARGTKGGGYPADPYDSDIMAFEYDSGRKGVKKVQEELAARISGNTYFQSSLIFAMADGRLGSVKSSTRGLELVEMFNPEIERLLASNAEYDSELITLDLRPLVRSPFMYKPETVDFLAESIVSILTNKKSDMKKEQDG